MLKETNRRHTGAYLCIASNGIPPSVSKRIMVIVNCKLFHYQKQNMYVQPIVCSSAGNLVQTRDYFCRSWSTDYIGVPDRIASEIDKLLDA